MEMREVGRRRDGERRNRDARSAPKSSPASSSLFLPRGRVIAGPFRSGGTISEGPSKGQPFLSKINAVALRFLDGEAPRAPLEHVYQGRRRHAAQIEQRIERLQTRLRETAFWRVRETRDIEGWRCDGQPIAIGAPWPSREGIVRFAAEASVPDDWPLDETRLSLDLGGESLLTLDYESGARVAYGLDVNHQEFPLAGRRLTIRSESVARRPFGQPVAEPRLQRAHLVWLDLALVRFADRRYRHRGGGDLGAHEAAEPLVEAAEAALRAIDWPSTTADYIARVAPAPSQQALWRRPRPSPIPRRSMTPSARRSQRRTPHCASGSPSSPPISAAGRSGDDRPRPYRSRLVVAVRRDAAQAAAQLLDRAGADARRAGIPLQPVERAILRAGGRGRSSPVCGDPERVAAGQWEPIGAMWVEPDTNMPCGESLARQILYGQRYFERAFGQRHRVCWLPDCFGFSPALPQLLRQGGIDLFLTIKVTWSETNAFPHDLFWWEGLDGSRVLAHTFDNRSTATMAKRGPDASRRPGPISAPRRAIPRRCSASATATAAAARRRKGSTTSG